MRKRNNNVRMTGWLRRRHRLRPHNHCCCLECTQNRRGHTYHCMRINTFMGRYAAYVRMGERTYEENFEKIYEVLISYFPILRSFRDGIYTSY